MSGKQLRVKDLIAVKFTRIADRDDKTATIVKQVRYTTLSVSDCYNIIYICFRLVTCVRLLTMC